MRPRRLQQPVTIRSDRAAARLRLLTRDGRSQAEVIEQALDRMAGTSAGPDQVTVEARVAALKALIGSARDIPSMADFDSREYDKRGNPR